MNVITTAGGGEYWSLRHPFVQRSCDLTYGQPSKVVREQIIDFYGRCGGMFRGFRLKDAKDFTTRNYVEPPTAFDQAMLLDNPTVPGIYQLMRWYGNSTDPMCSRRRIRKLAAGTVKVGVGGQVLPATQWSVDNTTGLVTLAANKTRSITAISKASSAVITVGSHTFVVGDSVVITGVAGMTQINGRRALVSAISGTTITVAINSALFSDYSSGGAVNTAPQAGEAITAGCEFDIPCRFDGPLEVELANLDFISADGVQVVEILNP